ncbi:MAG: DUF4435 domain-containing protein [Rikenellaceae bacterium]
MDKRFKHRGRFSWQKETPKHEFVAQRLPTDKGKRLVKAYVEGYEDVAFWRGIFDDFESDTLTFEVSVPPREDLAKGKKVLLKMLPFSSHTNIMCVDSDFDYLFDDLTEQSALLNSSQFMFHTYAYATENYVCYAPTLHNVCVKATKNDTRIFDFEKFLAEYSTIIYPLFVWYCYSAQMDQKKVFTLIDFRSSVRLNYLEVENNGSATLSWLKRQVAKRVKSLEFHNPNLISEIEKFGKHLSTKEITPENTYLFMQGHTLMENVILIMLNAVCDELKKMSNLRIACSTKQGVALKNEMSNYNNSLRNVRDILLDNENYKECFLYQKLKEDIERYVASM